MLRTLIVFLIATGVQAGPITYSVVVNTGSISGQSGNVDFQFNPGCGLSDPAFVTISAFSSNGTLAGTPALAGGATGTLPPLVTIHNTSGFNDYSDAFTFGSFLSFLVRLDGAALTAPSGTATAGSVFAFSLFNSDFSAALLTTDTVNGVLVQADVDTRGKVTITNFGAPGTTSVTALPEPDSASLVMLALAGVALARIQRFQAIIFRATT